MLEVLVSTAVAAVTGLGVLASQVHRRISLLDNRIDGVELRIAEQYVTRAELTLTLDRIDAHILRIETKLDNLTQLPCINIK